MSAQSQYPIFRQTTNINVFLKLRSLWRETGKMLQAHAFLVTEKELLSLAEENSAKNIQQNLPSENFSLLITPHFSSLLSGLWQSSTQDYQTHITFDPVTIADYVSGFKNLCQKNSNIIKYLALNLNNHRKDSFDYLELFSNQLTKILDSERDYPQKSLSPSNSNYCCLNIITAKKMSNYQLESQQIIDQIQNQIEQKFDLLDIIQMTIDRVLVLLQIDRLIIYQLDVPLQDINSNFTNIDTVTYEAKSSELIDSVLNFSNETCLKESVKCHSKYRKGFTLIVDDIKSSSTLDPYLQNLMDKMQVKSKVVTPINLQRKLWGFLIAHQCLNTRQWNPSETEFLRDIANYIGFTINQDRSRKLLQRQKSLLEQRVKTQAHQIKDALVAAEIASQSKHEFIDNMSHEFKTPLTCIIGLSGTLIHCTSKYNQSLSIEKQQKYLKTIQDNGKKLLKLVNNILELSEVESGKHLLNITRFSLPDLLRNILPILNQEAEYKSINFSVDWQNFTPDDSICADQNRLEEILVNIAGNGIKFTPPEGKVDLRIIKQKSQIIFQIEDTGIGISEQQMPLIFKKFQQIDYSRRRVYGGAGLGLALTKHLVELHGGNIEVESVVNQGSIFTVYLPIKESKNPELLNNSVVLNKSKTIVLITQDEEISTFICEVLTAAQYQVVWLVDSSISPDQIQLLQPILIILDKNCPEVSIEMIREQIEEQELLSKIKIVLLCDEMSASEWQHFAKYDVYDYLLKSMSFSQILNKIYTII